MKPVPEGITAGPVSPGRPGAQRVTFDSYSGDRG